MADGKIVINTELNYDKAAKEYLENVRRLAETGSGE